jgi:hypothetical protein
MNPEPNDFAQLFSEYHHLRRVAFNGAKAELLWRRYIAPRPDVPHSSLATGALPSSSCGPGRHVLPFEGEGCSLETVPAPVIGSRRLSTQAQYGSEARCRNDEIKGVLPKCRQRSMARTFGNPFTHQRSQGGMERLSSLAGATGGNRSQMGSRQKRLK